MVGLKPKRFTTIQRQSRHFFLLFCRQGDVLDLYICDTNGKDDVYINDKLVEEGYAKFKQGMINNYWMRSSRIWGIIKAEADDTSRGLNNS